MTRRHDTHMKVVITVLIVVTSACHGGVILHIHSTYICREIFLLISEKSVLLNPFPRSHIVFFLNLFTSPSRAATLVRRTKGESRRGRSRPLRCDRQRRYGGAWGRETGEPTEKPLPTHWVTTPSQHTPHTPPAATVSLPVFFFSLLALTPLCLIFLLRWTDLCMPLLDSVAKESRRCCGLNFCFPASIAWLECREMVRRKTTKRTHCWVCAVAAFDKGVAKSNPDAHLHCSAGELDCFHP